MRRHLRYKPRSLRRLERRGNRNLIFSLILGLTLLYFLFSWGLPTLINSLSFFNKFKPSLSKQTQIDENAIAPPVLNIPFEATNTATIRISGYTQPTSLVEIYFDDQLKEILESGDNGKFESGSLSLSIGTNNIYGKTVDEKGNKSTPSKLIKLIYSNEKPKLELSEPPDNHQIKGGDKKLRVSGKTDPLSSVTVNGQTMIVTVEGNFSTEISLNDGENIITVAAISPIGNSTSLQRRVTFEP